MNAADAQAQGQAQAPAPAPGKGEPTPVAFSRIRRTMARRMAEMATIPAFYLRVDADVAELLELRAELRAGGAATGEPVPSVNDFVIAACGRALVDHPLVNASLGEQGGAVTHARVNVGCALSADGELLVPTVYDADAKSAREIARETRELVARAPRFSIDELRDGTFTVSNLGMFGVHGFDAIVNGPQVAILAVGAARSAGDGTRSQASPMQLSLGCDHRVLTGTDGARFLADVKDLLEQAPRALLEPASRQVAV